jgi:hypothetical protein
MGMVMRTKLPLVLTVSTLLAILPTPASAASPPKIPGKTYVKSLDGCGSLINDASATPQVLDYLSKPYWIGECRHGLANGFGYWLDPASDFFALRMAYMQFGSEQLTRANIVTSAGVWEGIGGPSRLTYTLWNESKSDFAMAFVPTHWSINASLTPFYTSNNGSSFDDFDFMFSDKNSSKTEKTTGFIISIGARSCLIAGKKISGCKALYNEFDVYGVLIQNSIGTDTKESFTLCPNPKTTVGCDALWQDLAGPYIEKIVNHVKQTRSVMASEQEVFSKASIAAEAALPADWKSHWKASPVSRLGVDMALKCRELSDFHPVSLADAFYIKQKYTTAPCNTAITAAYAATQASNFITYDSKGKDQEAAMRESYARAKADLDAYNAEAWSGFFKTTSAMLGAGIQIQQQRIDNTNAQIAAANQQAAEAPVYQSYGQPLMASSGQQSYDPSKVQIRPIHKPEWDALQCLKLNQTGRGDSVLTGTGSQYFLNTCDKAIEVFWCKVGDECERGSGNTWKIHPQNTWPLSSGQYQAGACISGSSGGFVKDSSGKITGRYACTGP